MKKVKIIYWTATALFAFMMFGSAIPDVFSQELAVKGIHLNLGYPLYIIPFLGIAKCFGVFAILVPGFPKIKEWAYAGLFFDLIGATYSIYSSGGNGGGLAFMLMPLLLGIISYTYYGKKQGATKAKSEFTFAV